MSLNNEENCHKIREDKIAICKQTAGLRSGDFLDLNSACFSFKICLMKVNDIGAQKMAAKR